MLDVVTFVVVRGAERRASVWKYVDRFASGDAARSVKEGQVSTQASDKWLLLA